MIKEVYRGEKIVIIENEFGEVGIDKGFLEDAAIEITEINSGCICCTLAGDFEAALEKVVRELDPERIVIEPSGVGKLSDIKDACSRVPGVEEGVAITVADAKKFRMYSKNFGEFFNNQLENADIAVLSHTEDVDEDTLTKAVHGIKHLNGHISVVTQNWDDISGSQIMEACHHGEQHHHHHEHCCCHDHNHHHHHADEIFESFGAETVHVFTQAELENILKGLGEEILRAKGMVRGEEGWLFFDYVPGETDIREGKPQITGKISVIGTRIDEDEIRKAFSC